MADHDINTIISQAKKEEREDIVAYIRLSAEHQDHLGFPVKARFAERIAREIERMDIEKE